MWQQVNAPRYQKEFITVICLAVCIIITAFGTMFLHKREIENNHAENIRSQMEREGYRTGIETPPQQTVDVHGEGKAFLLSVRYI